MAEDYHQQYLAKNPNGYCGIGVCGVPSKSRRYRWGSGRSRRGYLASISTPRGYAKQILGIAIDRTAQAITDGRNAVQGLRASTIESNDLAEAIGTLGEELAAEAGGHALVRLSVKGGRRVSRSAPDRAR